MRRRSLGGTAIMVAISWPVQLMAGARICYGPEDALRHLNQDACISAHVYDVVQLTDGTRLLDVCSPQTPDRDCIFSIVSLREDRKEVGDLDSFKGKDIQIRGVIHSFNDQAAIVLSNSRQFHGGPEKFRPNPELIRGFSAEDGKSAFEDPAFKSSGHHHKTISPP